MNKKKILFLTLCSAATVAATIAVTSSYKNSNGLRAAGETTWKHFSAVMPTANESGIREYWTNCVGGAPVFEEPKDVVAAEANLTTDQINAILADKSDPRIIPSLTRIQNAVNKNVDGTLASDLTFVNDAVGYTYLDATTKASITGADATAILNAKTTFDKNFTVVFDAGKDNLPTKDQEGVTLDRGYDNDKGDVLTVNTTLGSAGKTSQLYFYGFETNGVIYGENDFLSFSVYSPFASEANTSQTFWVGDYGTAVRYTATPLGWTTLSNTGAGFNSNEKCKTAFAASINLQRYVDGTVTPFEGTYKMTSIVAEKELTEEGAAVIRGKNNITNANTWGEDAAVTEITYGVDTIYGKATQVDIKSKTSVLELKWDNAKYNNLKNYKYARMYVYAKSTQRVFVSLNYWRNNVVSIPGAEPFVESTATTAKSLETKANVVADQWNIIDIPASYFRQDTNSTFYVQVWNDVNEAKDGWLFTDFIGHNGDAVIENGGLLVNSTYSTKVTRFYDEDKGMTTRLEFYALQSYIQQNVSTDISSFTTIRYSVKNETSKELSIYLYKLNSTAYGNAVKGSYLVVKLAPNAWTDFNVDIAEYFGSYASTSNIMFRVDGAIGDSVLFSGFTVC